MHVLPLFKIALLASITVSLWTVRVALTARGRRYAGALVAVVEAMTFATVFAEVLDSVDSPTRLSAYGIGVGAGTLAGLAIDQRLRHGFRTASRHHRDATLRARRHSAEHRSAIVEPASCPTVCGASPRWTGPILPGDLRTTVVQRDEHQRAPTSADERPALSGLECI